MKLKGISTIEQHIEKIVLIVLAVVFLGALASQFLLQPNRVEVSANQTRPPGEIYEVLENKARSLEGQLNNTNVGVEDDVTPVDLLSKYDQAFAGQRPAALEPVFGAGLGGAVAVATTRPDGQGGPGGGGIALLVPPQPETPTPYAQWQTLDPFAVASSPALQAIAPDQQPYDVASVSVEAIFDGTQLLNELTSPAAGRPIPRKLWAQTGMAILSVQLERQRRDDRGAWGPAQLVGPSMTAFDPVAALDIEAEFADLVDAVRSAGERADDVARPEFLPTVSGLAWAPPTDAIKRDMVARNQPEIDRLERRIEQLGGDASRPSRQDRPGGRGATRDPDRNDRPTRPQPGNTNTDRNQRQIEELERRIRELRGEDEENEDDARRPSRTRGTPELLEDPSVRVWAHDLSAEPGAEYRYRMRVAVNNPLFDQGALVDAGDEEGLAAVAQPLAWSDWSDWSEPATLGAREYVFVSSATPDGLGGEGRATLEAYTMYYGFYRSVSISASVGDAIRRRVQLPEGLFLIDPVAASRAEVSAWLEAASEQGEDDDASMGAAPAGVSAAPDRLTLDTGWIVADVFSEFAFGSGTGSSGTRVAVRREDGSVALLQAGEREQVREMVALSAQVGERTKPLFSTTALPERDFSRPGLSPDNPRDERGPGGGKTPDDGP